ncbi:hypothetical protein DLJ49_05940 [Rhodovulum sp. 12E13]|uniref:hypothetical protein n=1 Tax=Rhodovulum sp. 12E13 TaxID=2203891 RepID=UPI000E146348|nr:hypothetical protein [Rhodovulum sp. 12E13]RDC73657.1 hypothetical protein DLJ49_05940 [Rhodovulum sp. 12E13]
MVAPGFVDVQINGGGGVLFNDAPTPHTPARRAEAARVRGDRPFLVTDAMATLGSDLDAFDLFGMPVRLAGGRLVSPEGTLAGAPLAMDAAARRMVALGVAEAKALDMASGWPARAAGPDGLGRIVAGGGPCSPASRPTCTPRR